jgi:hypothetical protein
MQLVGEHDRLAPDSRSFAPRGFRIFRRQFFPQAHDSFPLDSLFDDR